MSKLKHTPGTFHSEMELMWEVLFATFPEMHREYEKIMMVRKLTEPEPDNMEYALDTIKAIRARRLSGNTGANNGI